VVYTTPPPAFSLFAKAAKLPSALVATSKYSPPKYVPPAAGPDLPRETPRESAVLGRAPIPARRNSDGGQTMTRVLGLKLGRVVIDAGHGGHDDGTHGSSGMKEKDLVLDVALRVGALLEQRLGSEVVYTRSDDTFIPLEERTRIANEKRADLFLSIHANSSPDRSVSGIETYYLSLNGAKVALDTAARENAGSQHSIFDLKELLTKIALKDKIDESREFASAIQSSLFSLTQKNGKSSHDRGTKRAPFIVLIGADMPSVLAEIGFLTNSSEESLLRKDEYRDKVAEALYRGVESYAETLSRTVVARSK
jgi:N-acetylmuramoyl-L-alanine amidase